MTKEILSKMTAKDYNDDVHLQNLIKLQDDLKNATKHLTAMDSNNWTVKIQNLLTNLQNEVEELKEWELTAYVPMSMRD